MESCSGKEMEGGRGVLTKPTPCRPSLNLHPESPTQHLLNTSPQNPLPRFFMEGGPGSVRVTGLACFKAMAPWPLPVPFPAIPPGPTPSAFFDSPTIIPASQGEPSSMTGNFTLPPPLRHESCSSTVADPTKKKMLKPFPRRPLRPLAAVGAFDFGHKEAWIASFESTIIPSTSPLPSSAKLITPLQAESPSEISVKTLSIAEKPSGDGYNWRKYGQKQVKGSEFPRSYYKCTHPYCPVKKKVEQSFQNGHISEIIYKGEHNHLKPPQVAPTRHFPSQVSDNGTPAMPSSPPSSDCSEKNDSKASHADTAEPNYKRRKVENDIDMVPIRTVRKPRVVVQMNSNIDIPEDGYRWRKYGQKVVKGNPHPRSYYKCTNLGCNVRKHVERSSMDPNTIITAYEGNHNHHVPYARNDDHDTTTTMSSPPISRQSTTLVSNIITNPSQYLPSLMNPSGIIS